MRKTRDYKGITLVALIITIIVLVILTVVTIRAVTGDGIIQYAQNVREEYIMGQEEEKQLLDSYMTHLEENISETPYIAHNDKIPLGGKYITANGETLETTENNYVSFPNTVLDGDIYFYGDYEYKYNNYFTAGGSNKGWRLDSTQNGWGVTIKERTEKESGALETDNQKTSYDNILTTINGKNVTNMMYAFYGCKIMTVAPAVPKTVTNMDSTFYRCSALASAPKIPNGVINMRKTFEECTLLVTAPEIPDSVENMLQTFRKCPSLTTVPKFSKNVTTLSLTFEGCTSLTTVAEIPDSVTDMTQTFRQCESLKSVPEIPSSVTNMYGTFAACTSLEGDIMINAVASKVTSYDVCFTLTEKNIKLIGKDETFLNNLKNTANPNTHITIEIIK